MPNEIPSFSCSEIPYPRAIIVRRCDDMLPVGTIHGVPREYLECSDGSKIGVHFPNTRRLVVRSSDYLPAIGAEGGRHKVCSMAAKNRDRTASFHLPNPRRLVYGCGYHPAAIGTENSTVQRSTMAAEDHDRFTRAHRPDPRRGIV